MASISLCMIVRDEEAVLGRCLESVAPAVDEIIVVDTGSMDGTKAVAAAYTDLIFDFAWVDDFAAARNVSFAKATGDYILWLDADDVLQQALHDAFDCLNPGGRLVIITFHSLEDRMVKNAFAQWSKGCTCPKEFPVCVCGNKPKGKALKSVAPSAAELEENPRARSARLRVFEKY